MIICMSGIPGSGKSFQALKLAKRGNMFIVSADFYFLDKPFDPTLLSRAHGECFKRAIDWVSKGWDIVVDNTNLSAWEISPYSLLAQSLDTPFEIHRVECDPEVAFARQTHGVPRNSFDRMVQQFNKRDYLPWWRICGIH